jgi:hypothetical protein
MCCGCILQTAARATYARPRASSVWARSPGAATCCSGYRGNSFALELKASGGRLSDAQLEFLARFNDAGGHSASAEGLDRALAVLQAWQLLQGRAS